MMDNLHALAVGYCLLARQRKESGMRKESESKHELELILENREAAEDSDRDNNSTLIGRALAGMASLFTPTASRARVQGIEQQP